MNKWKKGDITKDGFEIVYVEYVPKYTFRRRIITTKEIIDSEGNIPVNSLGYLYYYPSSPRPIIQLDDGRPLRALHDEYEWYDEKI